MALTTTTTLANTISTYYDRLLLEVLDPKLLYYQFGLKKPLPTGEGKTVVWNLPYRLDRGYVLSEGSPVQLSTAYALSTYKVSAIVRQFGGFTVVTDFVDMTSITDVMKMAVERLATQAAETVERVLVNECFIAHVATLGGSAHHMIKTSTEITDYWGSVSGVSVCSNGTVPGGPIGTASCLNVMAVSDIKKAVYSLRRLNVPPYEGQNYVGILPSETAEVIAGDSTFINFHQYTDKGIDNLYKGEIGMVYGCRLIETTNGPAVRGSNDGSTASSIAYGTAIFGKGFYGVTELDGGIKTFMADGASKADPLNQVTTYGWKANFIAKLLNTSAGLVFWAGIGTGQSTAVGDESATGSPLRYKYPSSY